MGSVTREAASVSRAGPGRGVTSARVTPAVTFTASATMGRACVCRAGTDDTAPSVSNHLCQCSRSKRSRVAISVPGTCSFAIYSCFSRLWRESKDTTHYK